MQPTPVALRVEPVATGLASPLFLTAPASDSRLFDMDAGDPYAVPSDNPFVGTAGARGEVWAIGLRNPWRWAFDRTAGRLYVADVGQNAWEEVNAVSSAAAGVNYGWAGVAGHVFLCGLL